MPPVPQIIVAVKQGLTLASMESAEIVHHEVSGVLGSSKPPPSNATLDRCLTFVSI